MHMYVCVSVCAHAGKHLHVYEYVWRGAVHARAQSQLSFHRDPMPYFLKIF